MCSLTQPHFWVNRAHFVRERALRCCFYPPVVSWAYENERYFWVCTKTLAGRISPGQKQSPEIVFLENRWTNASYFAFQLFPWFQRSTGWSGIWKIKVLHLDYTALCLFGQRKATNVTEISGWQDLSVPPAWSLTCSLVVMVEWGKDRLQKVLSSTWRPVFSLDIVPQLRHIRPHSLWLWQ